MQFTEQERAEVVLALQAQVCQYAKIENQYRSPFVWLTEAGRAACSAKADEYAAKRHALEALIYRLEYVGGEV